MSSKELNMGYSRSDTRQPPSLALYRNEHLESKALSPVA
jgi:hypothetical protein